MFRVQTFFFGALLLLVAAGSPAVAAEKNSPFVIGYLEGDWTASEEWNRHPADMGRLPDYLPHRPFAGAEIGVDDAQYLGRGMGITYVLERRMGKTAGELLAALKGLNGEQGAKVFLVDAPQAVTAELAKLAAGMDVLLFNVSSFADSLRAEDCAGNLFHTLPNNAMLMDALVQFLVVKKWLRVLVLEGPLEEDKKMVAAFRRAAKRFGLKIVDVRSFLLTQDPRARESNRVEQLTSGDADSYDAVFVADAHGEFSYRVPYSTVLPRPVVGAHGLTPRAWHWSFLRHGAPQVNSRFERKYGRRMDDRDWAAWIAVKSVSEAVLRRKSPELAAIREHLLDQDIKLDAFKGGGYSYRPWDNQLRQPILMATDNWVAAMAPHKAYLHPESKLDTLGYDKPETQCAFN
ncbi:MAG: ABC transporter substrate-binding protein [Alphaproteobacteria bacterium]|nr:ABC transporter substrate-binding protein [Alphaproteobacteria bacterium]